MDDDNVEMDMTPMIDVSFQLLIFFLLTINFKLREGNLSSHLPKQGGAAPAKAMEQLNKLDIKLGYDPANSTTSLSINHDRYKSWKDGTDMDETGDRKGIGEKAWNAYQDIKKGMDEPPPIKINTDPTVPTGRVITTIDILKEYVIQPEKRQNGVDVPLKFKGASKPAIQKAIQ